MNESSLVLYNFSNTSSVNTHCKYNEPYSDLEQISIRVVFALLTTVGISLNIFVIILAVKFLERKNLHHLIINMAVSDALFLVMLLLSDGPRLTGIKSIYPTSTLVGVIFCKLTSFVKETSYKVSLFSLLVISIGRFKAVGLSAFQNSKRLTKKQRFAVLGFCWLIPLPASVCTTYLVELSTKGDCMIDVRRGSGPLAFYFLSIYNLVILIVCCVIVVLSIQTTRRLSKPLPIQANLSREQLNMRKRRIEAAVRTVLVSTLLYPLCFIPKFIHQLLLVVDAFILPKDAPGILTNSSVCIDLRSLRIIVKYFLPIINSCFSPCIYIIFLSDFRGAARKVFCRGEVLNHSTSRRNTIELQEMRSANSNEPNRRRRNSFTDDEKI